jgi:cyclic pyranopterin phosphate synthase
MNAGQSEVLADPYGRSIRYLRLSVTDRCNLRCLYCAPRAGAMKFIAHADVLRYEEFMRLIRLAVNFGVKKVRLTGGEPFVRLGFMDFIRAIRREFPLLLLGVTSNATLLGRHVRELKEAGLESLNISLDSFRADVFARITGRDLLKEVLAALEQALKIGLRVKINAVGLKGVNDRELPDFLSFVKNNPVDLRIIEYMPLGGRGKWKDEDFWPAAAILEEARKYAELSPARLHSGQEEPGGRGSAGDAGTDGPARLYDIAGSQGRFGIITPVSEHFCSRCNRLRVTAEGRLRTCLFSDREYDLRALLRDRDKSDADVRAIIREANLEKPLGSELLRARKSREAVIGRSMSSIGG